MLLIHNTWELEVNIVWCEERMIKSHTNNSSSTPKLQDYIRKKIHNIAHFKNNPIHYQIDYFLADLCLN